MLNRTLLMRLKSASVPELTYRVRQQLMSRRLKSGLFGLPKIPALPQEDPSFCLPKLFLKFTDVELHALLKGRKFYLNAEIDSLRAFEAEMQNCFSTDVWRHLGEIDIRQVWEPARLQHAWQLIEFARQYVNDCRAQEAGELGISDVVQWIEQNPFLHGPHYMSPMECGLRLPVFVWALKFLSVDRHRERRLLCEAIYLHAWWIVRRLALYSSLGNHTVAECVGLVFAGAFYHSSREGQRWMKTGIYWLGRELDHQLLKDGGPAEQSLNYHRMVLDLYWLALDFLRSNRLADCFGWQEKLQRGEDFLAAFKTGRETMPQIGDSDGGYGLGPGLAPQRNLTLVNKRCLQVFPESGYSLVRWLDDSLLSFDHGPLGMAPLHNHGHADALSVTLSLAGQPVLVDPGTYAYNGKKHWRNYFKSTPAHNTVTIDGQDQAVQETGFIWSKPYTSELVGVEKNPSGIILEAHHKGYQRLESPVIHHRSIFIKQQMMLIYDWFTGTGEHQFDLHFHLHPGVRAIPMEQGWRLEFVSGQLFIGLHAADFVLQQGGKRPRLGWYSPGYALKQRSPVLSHRCRGKASVVKFFTAIGLRGPVECDELIAASPWKDVLDRSLA